MKCAMLLFTISKLESNRATSSLRGIRCSSCNQPALYKYIYFQHSNKVLQAKIKPAVEVSEWQVLMCLQEYKKINKYMDCITINYFKY